MVEEQDGSPTSSGESADEADDVAHLDAIEDGSGCVEVWEQLSERARRDNR